ncbi:hypothetical protein FACS1894161_2410 [Spirochaetia bacterium]|nr:hypothetical protein FACS1894161_2410 [Spirochaetia bacterium]
MTVYISGPITGKRNGNRKAFEKAQEKLEKEFGYEEGKFRIISPVKIGETVNQNFEDTRLWLGKAIKPQWEDYMKACIKRLMDATHVFFLKGWDKSRGAVLERKIAEGLNIPCAETIEELKNSKGVDTWK